MSFAVSVEQATLPVNLSKSYISYNNSLSSLVDIKSFINFSVKFCLLVISSTSIDGLIIKLFNNLLPIAVLVLSIKPSKLFCLSLLLIVSTNSKFLIHSLSKSRNILVSIYSTICI